MMLMWHTFTGLGVLPHGSSCVCIFSSLRGAFEESVCGGPRLPENTRRMASDEVPCKHCPCIHEAYACDDAYMVHYHWPEISPHGTTYIFLFERVFC